MHSNVFYALRLHSIPCAEEPGMLQSIGLQKVGYDWATNTFTLQELNRINETHKNIIVHYI